MAEPHVQPRNNKQPEQNKFAKEDYALLLLFRRRKLMALKYDKYENMNNWQTNCTYTRTSPGLFIF